MGGKVWALILFLRIVQSLDSFTCGQNNFGNHESQIKESVYTEMYSFLTIRNRFIDLCSQGNWFL